MAGSAQGKSKWTPDVIEQQASTGTTDFIDVPGGSSASVNDQSAVIRAANDAFGTNASGPTNPGWMIGASEAPAVGESNEDE